MSTISTDSVGKFSKRFLWGASTSAHQVEGGLHNQWTVWELENAKSLATRAPYQFGDLQNWPHIAKNAKNPNNYVSGRAADHFNRFEEDFDILSKLNMNAFRFGIEWARVEPSEGVWDASAIDHYRKYLKALKARGITPVVTLLHFTLPVWFAEKGGFEKRRNVKYFLRFVQKVLEEMGGDIKWIITINEPTVYVSESYFIGNWVPNKTSKLLSIMVLNNLIVAHKKIYRLTRGSRHWQVSMAHHLSHFYAGDNAWLSRLSAWVADLVANRYVLARVKRHSDFIGLNYYFSYRIYGYRVHNPGEHQSDLGWDMQPAHLQYVLEDLSRRYDLPIMVTENGLADASDEQRKWWITESIIGMNQAMKNGTKLIGYLHWSLLDNFEWDKGFWPKFGLVSIHRGTMARTVRPSAEWFGAVIRKLRH